MKTRIFFDLKDNPDLSTRLQESLFKLGYKWGATPNQMPKHTSSPYIIISEEEKLITKSGSYPVNSLERKYVQGNIEDFMPKKPNTLSGIIISV